MWLHDAYYTRAKSGRKEETTIRKKKESEARRVREHMNVPITAQRGTKERRLPRREAELDA